MSQTVKYGPVPRRYADLVQRYAVLHSLMAPSRSDEGVIASTDAVRRQWITRAHQLRECGWSPRADPLTMGYVFNCRPAFVMTDGHRRACGFRDICPFCYARWVLDMWERIDYAHRLCGDEGYWVMRLHRRQFKRLPPEGILRADGLPWTKTGYLETLYDDAIGLRHEVVPHLGCLGGFWLVQAIPLLHGWSIQSRQVLLMQRDAVLPKRMIKAHGTFHQYDRLTRRKLMCVVAQVCRYSARLMTAEPERLLEILTARRRRHLYALIGCFRNTP